MRLIKVGATTLNQTPFAWAHNFTNIVSAIQEAQRQGVKVLCLPELCVTGYGCEDQFHSEALYANAYKSLEEIVKHTKGMIVVVGVPVLYNSSAYNTACVMVDGKIAGFVAKQFLAGDGVHYEGRWFKAWPAEIREKIEINGQKYNIGDLYFDINGIRLGIEICEDAWVPNRPGAGLARNGVDIILNPSASHFAFGKHAQRKILVTESSRAFGCAYIYCNLVGNESGRTIYSGDIIISSSGKEVANGPLFTYKDRLLTTAVIDLSANKTHRVRTASLSPEMEKPLWINCQDDLLSDDVDNVPSAAAHSDNPTKEEEFSLAVALGLFDYMRKTRSKGFVVSLSGGADSAACASLVWVMSRAAIKDLGVLGLKEKLSYMDLSDIKTGQDLTGRLLTSVYQGTRNSSEQTLKAAKNLAKFLGAEWHEFDIDDVVTTYTNIVNKSIGRKLTWKTDDITLQNIQARARAPGAWMLANIKYAILLSTSNRSEAAVGYATMDGDTSGGLAPIAGIDKHFLRSWLRHMESYILALDNVNNLVPTAELRPGKAEQTDENDLMPYDVLDLIEEMAIRDKKSPLEVLKLLSNNEKYTLNQCAGWVEKFFKLWSRNQWKRERYAPSFHLDDENLDPKTWCRFPILSGGFEAEIKEMWDYVRKI